jgi:C1A family cysteine protease
MTFRIKGFGWLKDPPSIKDYSAKDAERAINGREIHEKKSTEVMNKILPRGTTVTLPASVDNRKWCSPIRDQGNLGSCTAFMACGMYEYMCKRGHSKYEVLSPLFTYKSTRWLMNLEGDTGAWIRSAIGSLAIHGSPPEERWEYDVDAYEEIPNPFVHGYAQQFQALKYFRLDKGIPSDQTLVDRMKDYISRGFPLGIGFSVFESYEEATSNGGFIPYPHPNEEMVGGHAVFIVGYKDDNFLFKNSWSRDWGDKGYGWIPMKYFIREPDMDAPLADDVWTITKYEWMESDQFGFHDE